MSKVTFTQYGGVYVNRAQVGVYEAPHYPGGHWLFRPNGETMWISAKTRAGLRAYITRIYC
jgi:hypothetical protein